MAVVTGNIETWGLAPYGVDERLLIGFWPSSAAAVVNTILPLRTEKVAPNANGYFTATLAATTNLVPDAWYTIRAEWFQQNPITGTWDVTGWSELPGKLRVPVGGGNIATLLERPPVPGSIVVGTGAPPPNDTRVWIDWSDVTAEGVRVYAPGGIV
ncbi:hypothetical protein [Microbacterium resistens]